MRWHLHRWSRWSVPPLVVKYGYDSLGQLRTVQVRTCQVCCLMESREVYGGAEDLGTKEDK